jgi:hypothetical protein
VVSTRRGAGAPGCLLALLVLSAILYFAVQVGEVYWRAWLFRDEMQQQANFAGRTPDARIAARLRSVADSLGLPESARRVHIRRAGGSITITASYYERVEFPLRARDVHFNPVVTGRP